MLWRVFPFHLEDPAARPQPLAVDRERQGAGRHDNPDVYAALYLSREPVSAVAEFLQAFRGRTIGDRVFARPDGRHITLASLDEGGLPRLVDLDDPSVLVRIGWRPSEVATAVRQTMQRLALELFRAEAAGLSWWSTLEAAWTNVTLFDVRIPRLPDVVGVERLGVEHEVVNAAADRLGVTLIRGGQAGTRIRSDT